MTRHTVAYSPSGDTIVLAIAVDSSAFDVAAALGDGTYWHRPHGDYMETLRTILWFIPVASGTNRSVVVPDRVEALALSEDGSHLVLQVRNFFYNWTTTGATGGRTIIQHNMCSAEYRRANGSLAFATIPTRHRFSYATTCYPGAGLAP